MDSSDSYQLVASTEQKNFPDIEVLEHACKEARTVLDHQIDLKNDIDDKSMRTARIITLALSVVVGLIGFQNNTSLSGLLNGFMSLGVLLVAFSLIVLIISYFASDPKLGPSPQYIEQDVLKSGLGEHQYRKELLEAYAVWIENTGDAVQLNGAILSVGETLFAVGILSFILGLMERVWETSLLQWVPL